jgi:hypothetical protein
MKEKFYEHPSTGDDGKYAQDEEDTSDEYAEVEQNEDDDFIEDDS